MKGYENRWEASINMFYRFTFEIHTDYYLFRRIGPHDIVLKTRDLKPASTVNPRFTCQVIAFGAC
jgi:hypothetical protein